MCFFKSSHTLRPRRLYLNFSLLSHIFDTISHPYCILLLAGRSPRCRMGLRSWKMPSSGPMVSHGYTWKFSRLSFGILTLSHVLQSLRRLGTRRRRTDCWMRCWPCAATTRGVQSRRSMNPSCASTWNSVYSSRTTGKVTFELEHDDDSSRTTLVYDILLKPFSFLFPVFATSLLLMIGTRRMGSTHIGTWASRRKTTQCL